MNSVTAKETMFIFQNKSRNIITVGEKIWKTFEQDKRRYFFTSPPPEKLPVWPPVPFSFIDTHVALAERKGQSQEYLAT